MDRCGRCGFEYDLELANLAGPAVIYGSEAIAAHLQNADLTVLRTRPQRDVWCPLEYGCHVRDVLLIQRERVLAARRMDRPSFDPMGRDERVEHDGYLTQDPMAVARQLNDAAAMFANVLNRLEPEDWDRTVLYNYPGQLERTLRWVAVHTDHEVKHHLKDIEGQVSQG